MAYDLDLADRVRASFRRHAMHFAEKTMMGGLCFMVDGKMCVAVDQSRLMVRLDPETYEESLKQPGCTRWISLASRCAGSSMCRTPG